MLITDIRIREIWDSRGDPTVETDIFTDGNLGRAAAPSGASVGAKEAKSLPISDAIANAKKSVIPELIGEELNQREVDSRLRDLDSTDDFSKIGVSVATAISISTAKAAAESLGIPLYKHITEVFSTTECVPYPLGNVIGGGKHADATDIQEFLVIPVGARDVKEGIRANALVHKEVKSLLSDKNISCGKGDEGAWAPQIDDETAMDILVGATNLVQDNTGVEIKIGVDVAASSLWDGNEYRYRNVRRSREEQIQYISELIDRYELYYVEDPMEENDFDGFAEFSGALICGDDLFVTNADRIKKGASHDSGNTVLIKPNQVGTLTDTYEAINMARKHGYGLVMSHRSGETTDNTIAHLAVGWGIPIIKTGVVSGERIAKLNELIRISEGLDRMASLQQSRE